MTRRSFWASFALGAVILLLTACGGSGGGYPSDFHSQFVSECRSSAADVAALSQSGVSSSTINGYCNCAIGKIQGHYSYKQYSSDPLAALNYAVGFCQIK